MSGIDLTIIVSVVAALVVLLSKTWSHYRWIQAAIPGTLVVLIVIRLLLLPMVWTMMPAVIVSGGIVLHCLLLIRRTRRSRSEIPQRKRRRPMFIRRLGAALLAILLAVIAAAPPTLLPVFSLEQPGGPYAIGTSVYHWTDESRSERASDDPSRQRELTVQVWYPADPQSVVDLERAPYLPEWDVMAPALAQRYHFPEFLLSHLNQIESHGYKDAPVSASQARYPVVLFSHGMPGLYATDTFLFEALASSGYIVLSINHTNYSIASKLQDGTVATVHNDAFPSPADWDANDALIANVWAKDASFVLDQLERLDNVGVNPNFPLAGHLDWEHVGMAGHSFGGANAVEMLCTDERVKAAVNMDGTMFGTGVRSTSLQKPLLLLQSKRPESSGEPSDPELRSAGLTRAEYDKLTVEIPRREANALAAQGSRAVMIEGADHLAFTDLYRLSPLLPLMNRTGSLNNIHQRITSEVVNFFNTQLKQ
ncbi:carboxylic ester hydrolase [Paenibacillus sp. CCS19]|uniref:alpha/beta hydrolase family protein n=1 Tax=Paenibacillus sp. CCS19 TaxID=3158387 RepID=UPI00256DE96E|nr:hypothetical protein [Paenibacillus cellulosilyticus]GMK39270.1 carboxylic ester hydrolase [Paenibacillus cellulosilyticus]